MLLNFSSNHPFQLGDASRGGGLVLLSGVSGALQGGLCNGGSLSLGMTLPANLRNVFLSDHHRPPPDPWPCPGLGNPRTNPNPPSGTTINNNNNISSLHTASAFDACTNSLNPTCKNQSDSNHAAVTFPTPSHVGVDRFHVHKDHPPDTATHPTALLPCPAAVTVTSPALPSASFFELPVLPPGQPPPQAEPLRHHPHHVCDPAAAAVAAANPSLLLLCCPPQQHQQQLSNATPHCCSCCCLRRRQQSPEETAAAAASSTSQMPSSCSSCSQGSIACCGVGDRRQMLEPLALGRGLTAPQGPSVTLVSSPPSPALVTNKAAAANMSAPPSSVGVSTFSPATAAAGAVTELGVAQKTPQLKGDMSEKGSSKEEAEVSGGDSGGTGQAVAGVGGVVGGGFGGAARALLQDLQGRSGHGEQEDDDTSQDSGDWADVTVGSTDDDDEEWSLTGESLDDNTLKADADVGSAISQEEGDPGGCTGYSVSLKASSACGEVTLEDGACVTASATTHLSVPPLLPAGNKSSSSAALPRSPEVKGDKPRPFKRGGGKTKAKRYHSSNPVATRKNLGVKEPIGQKRAPMMVVSSDELCESDVLAGRGGHAIHNSGNRAFRELVEARLVQYANSNKNGKTQMATEIVERIRQSGGRFLSRLTGGKQKEDGSEFDVRWEVLPMVKARYKVSQRFRQAISAAGIPGGADRIPFSEEEGE